MLRGPARRAPRWHTPPAGTTLQRCSFDPSHRTPAAGGSKDPTPEPAAWCDRSSPRREVKPGGPKTRELRETSVGRSPASYSSRGPSRFTVVYLPTEPDGGKLWKRPVTGTDHPTHFPIISSPGQRGACGLLRRRTRGGNRGSPSSSREVSPQDAPIQEGTTLSSRGLSPPPPSRLSQTHRRQ